MTKSGNKSKAIEEMGKMEGKGPFMRKEGSTGVEGGVVGIWGAWGKTVRPSGFTSSSSSSSSAGKRELERRGRFGRKRKLGGGNRNQEGKKTKVQKHNKLV
jgi:hypothetical protein